MRPSRQRVVHRLHELLYASAENRRSAVWAPRTPGRSEVVGKRQLYPSWLILRDPQIGPAAQREIWLGEILEKTEWPIDELICAPNPIENVIVVALLRVRIQVDHIAINNGFVLVDRDVCQPAVDHANHGMSIPGS